MSDRLSKVWIAVLFNLSPGIPYWIQAALFGIIIFIIFYIFSLRVEFFYLETYHLIEVSATCISIAFQLAGINYLLKDMKNAFQTINRGEELEKTFSNTNIYYLIILLVIMPFLALNAKGLVEASPALFSVLEPTIWSIALDVYNYATVYFMLLLLATTLWIIFNVSIILNAINSNSTRNFVKIDIYNTDRIGGLSPLRSFILHTSFFYFLSISLAIASYINPFNIISHEGLILLILLIVGFVFIYISFKSIRKILQKNIYYKTKELDLKTKLSKDKLNHIASTNNFSNKLEIVLCHSSLLQFYLNERIFIEKINKNGYNLKTLIQILGLIQPPFIAIFTIYHEETFSFLNKFVSII